MITIFIQVDRLSLSIRASQLFKIIYIKITTGWHFGLGEWITDDPCIINISFLPVIVANATGREKCEKSDYCVKDNWQIFLHVIAKVMAMIVVDCFPVFTVIVIMTLVIWIIGPVRLESNRVNGKGSLEFCYTFSDF